MGKGDIRTRRGKIWRRTYGVTRPRKWKITTPARVVKSHKVKTLKDLPKAVTEPIEKIAVEAVIPPHQEVIKTQVQTAEAIHPAKMETLPVGIDIQVPLDEGVVAIKEKSKPSKTSVKKAPAAKKAKKKAVAKKPATKKTASKKKK